MNLPTLIYHLATTCATQSLINHVFPLRITSPPGTTATDIQRIQALKEKFFATHLVYILEFVNHSSGFNIDFKADYAAFLETMREKIGVLDRPKHDEIKELVHEYLKVLKKEDKAACSPTQESEDINKIINDIKMKHKLESAKQVCEDGGKGKPVCNGVCIGVCAETCDAPACKERQIKPTPSTSASLKAAECYEERSDMFEESSLSKKGKKRPRNPFKGWFRLGGCFSGRH